MPEPKGDLSFFPLDVSGFLPQSQYTPGDVLAKLVASSMEGVKAPDFGIGSTTAQTMTGSADNYGSGGVFYCPAALTNAPFGGAYNAQIFVMAGSPGGCTQIAFIHGSTGRLAETRSYNGSTWSAWRSLFDADTASGFGIGTEYAAVINDANTVTKGGFYFLNDGALNRPSDMYYGGPLMHVSVISQDYGLQLTFEAASGKAWSRTKISGIWRSWVSLWNGENTGNGGQPPQPKARGMSGATKDALGVGQSWTEDLVSGATVTRPNCGGTVHLQVLTYGVLVGGSALTDWTGGGDGGSGWGAISGNGRIRWTRITQ